MFDRQLVALYLRLQRFQECRYFLFSHSVSCVQTKQYHSAPGCLAGLRILVLCLPHHDRLSFENGKLKCALFPNLLPARHFITATEKQLIQTLKSWDPLKPHACFHSHYLFSMLHFMRLWRITLHKCRNSLWMLVLVPSFLVESLCL